jgi:hypothetical protein
VAISVPHYARKIEGCLFFKNLSKHSILLWHDRQVDKKSDALLLKKKILVVVFVFICEYLTLLRMRIVNVYDQMKTEEVIFDTLLFLLENLISAQMFLSKYVSTSNNKSQRLYQLLHQLKFETINLRLCFETLLLLASVRFLRDFLEIAATLSEGPSLTRIRFADNNIVKSTSIVIRTTSYESLFFSLICLINSGYALVNQSANS